MSMMKLNCIDSIIVLCMHTSFYYIFCLLLKERRRKKRISYFPACTTISSTKFKDTHKQHISYIYVQWAAYNNLASIQSQCPLRQFAIHSKNYLLLTPTVHQPTAIYMSVADSSRLWFAFFIRESARSLSAKVNRKYFGYSLRVHVCVCVCISYGGGRKQKIFDLDLYRSQSKRCAWNIN